MNEAAEILLFFFGLLSLVVALVWLLLPVVSWMRTSRLQREVADLRARLSSLEASVAARPHGRSL